MPKHKCPFPECVYETEDVGDELAAVLISVHAKGAHTSPPADGTSSQTARIEKVRRPTISSAGTSDEWSYFMTRWTDYAEATKVQGKDKVIQLLECCEEQLRKDLTRTAGGSLTNKTAEEVLEAIKVPITPQIFFRRDESLSHAEQNSAKIFGFGQNWNFLWIF